MMTEAEAREWRPGVTFDIYGAATFRMPDGGMESRSILRAREIEGIQAARVRAGDMLRDIATEAEKPGRLPNGAALCSATVEIYPNVNQDADPCETFRYSRARSNRNNG